MPQPLDDMFVDPAAALIWADSFPDEAEALPHSLL